MNYNFPVDILLETCAQEMHDYRTLQSIIQEGKDQVDQCHDKLFQITLLSTDAFPAALFPTLNPYFKAIASPESKMSLLQRLPFRLPC